MGFLTSYIFNHDSYNIISGCKLNDPNCTTSELFCSGKTNNSIFGLCLVGGIVSTCILIACLIIGMPILYYTILGISCAITSIIIDILDSFEKTKASMTIPELNNNNEIELESNSINLTIDDTESQNNEFSSISIT
jgi:hypothetical protein